MRNVVEILPAAMSEPAKQRSLRAILVTNVFPTPASPSAGTFAADQVAGLRAAGVSVELVYVPRHERGRHVYRGLGRRVSELARASGSDVVHVLYGGVMADVVTRVVREAPVVVSFIGTDLLGGKGRGLVHSLSRRYGVTASRRAAGRAAGVVVKSENLLDALPGGVDRSRVWVVPDGVDLDRFRPLDGAECQAGLGWDPARRHVLFPGSSARPEKRFALADASVELLRRRGADVELHVLDGIGHDVVPTWLNAADVVLLTSTHEGSPNVVKEALACNVSVVSVDVGDVRERIETIEGCYLAEPTPKDIAAKLASAFEREERIAGREHVEGLSRASAAEKLREIYEAVSDRRTGGDDRDR
jgi:teichuronic acid biosynthesis glycosyltransferase TuaC